MSVDIFGRHIDQAKSAGGPPGVGYKVTTEGQYDIDNKRLCNVAEPNEINDAVNLATLQRIINV